MKTAMRMSQRKMEKMYHQRRLMMKSMGKKRLKLRINKKMMELPLKRGQMRTM